MNWRDIRPGVTVYHTIYTHWGPGVVEKVVPVNLGESMFERGTRRILVWFENREDVARMQLKELRKTPNRKKILAMVDMYQRRGVQAEDGGDRLILPMEEYK